jgi:hypothetical protein
MEDRSEGMKKHFFEGRETFGIVRDTGTLDKLNPVVFRRARDELAILAVSQLGYSRRKWMAVPAMAGERPAVKHSYLAINANDSSWSQSSSIVSALEPLILNEQWLRFHEGLFFFDLVRILRGGHAVTKEWHRDLWNAAVLIGQSQTSMDVPQAFLWNMIALELLLTRQTDAYLDALPARAEAFLGWVGYWQLAKFDERIRDVYKKRCALVHRGHREAIAPADLLFTDDLILNLLLNIVNHIALFPSKDAIADFSEKVRAERLLGARPKVRPKTLRFISRRYRDADYHVY